MVYKGNFINEIVLKTHADSTLPVLLHPSPYFYTKNVFKLKNICAEFAYNRKNAWVFIFRQSFFKRTTQARIIFSVPNNISPSMFVQSADSFHFHLNRTPKNHLGEFCWNSAPAIKVSLLSFRLFLARETKDTAIGPLWVWHIRFKISQPDDIIRAQCTRRLSFWVTVKGDQSFFHDTTVKNILIWLSETFHFLGLKTRDILKKEPFCTCSSRLAFLFVSHLCQTSRESTLKLTLIRIWNIQRWERQQDNQILVRLQVHWETPAASRSTWLIDKEKWDFSALISSQLARWNNVTSWRRS
jgi:hypothetical protein